MVLELMLVMEVQQNHSSYELMLEVVAVQENIMLVMVTVVAVEQQMELTALVELLMQLPTLEVVVVEEKTSICTAHIMEEAVMVVLGFALSVIQVEQQLRAVVFLLLEAILITHSMVQVLLQ